MFIMATRNTQNYSASKNRFQYWRKAPSPKNEYAISYIKVNSITGQTLGSNGNPGIKANHNPSNNFGNKTTLCATTPLEIKGCGTKTKGFRKPCIVSRETKRTKKRLITVRFMEDNATRSDVVKTQDTSKPGDSDTYELDLVGPFPNLKTTPLKQRPNLEKSKTNTESNLKKLGSDNSQFDNSLWDLILLDFEKLLISDTDSFDRNISIQAIDSMLKCEDVFGKTANTYAGSPESRKRKSFMSGDMGSRLPPSKRLRMWD